MRANLFHHDLLASLAFRSRSYLEIGVQEGLSVAAVANANRQIGLTLCDTWGTSHGGTGRGSHAHVDAILDAVGHSGARVYLDGPSAEQIPTLAGARFDLVHIDGDHSYEGALGDLRLTWELFAVALVVHDMDIPSVRSAVFDFIEERRVGAVGARVLPNVRRAWLSLYDHESMVFER